MDVRTRSLGVWLLCTILIFVMFVGLEDFIANKWLRMLAAGATIIVATILLPALYSVRRKGPGGSGE